jgi:hypothetical protein
MKKIIAILLAALTLFALTVNASAVTPGFQDVPDENIARDVAVLQMMGVISGDGSGNFRPNQSLTRAEFCKMAVIAMGRDDEEPLYRNITKFPDVRSTHWARGYINLAVSGEKRIITGYSDGYFKPEEAISYAQAITIVMRILGYSDADAGMMWPSGYLSLAADNEVTDGIIFSDSSAEISRADAAVLFCNLLGSNKKEGGSFVEDIGTTIENVVVMELDVTATNGTKGAIRTSNGVFLSERGVVPAGILGMRGTLVKGTNGKVITFVPNNLEQKRVVAASADATWIKDSSGNKYTIPATALAYTASGESTYGTAFIDIYSGMQVILYYAGDGTVEAVYINTSTSNAAMVYGVDGSLNSLTGGESNYTIYKNGVQVDSSDIAKYDVLTYDRSSKILYVSDFRLMAYYEGCWPNSANPSKVTIFGTEFGVLSSAASTLANFNVGQVATFLFTQDFQIAGAVSNITGSTAIGIVQPGVSGSSAMVKLLNGVEIKGNPDMTDYTAAKYAGELVTVGSPKAGYISLSKLGTSAARGNLDLTKNTLGTYQLSPAIRIFERVGKSGVIQLTWDDITVPTVNRSKIVYSSIDQSGCVDMLVLDDVTGDCYTYGIFQQGVDSYDNKTISVVNGDNKSGTAPVPTGLAFTQDAFGGLAVEANGETVAGIVQLTKVSNVSRSSFRTVDDITYLTIDGKDIPVATNVQCYNKMGDSWFKTLNDARAFSETLTVYYDRTPEEGGKIRVVVAE